LLKSKTYHDIPIDDFADLAVIDGHFLASYI
jgi:hypothetical protein